MPFLIIFVNKLCYHVWIPFPVKNTDDKIVNVEYVSHNYNECGGAYLSLYQIEYGRHQTDMANIHSRGRAHICLVPASVRVHL